jgi:hypothetical protein
VAAVLPAAALVQEDIGAAKEPDQRTGEGHHHAGGEKLPAGGDLDDGEEILIK